MDVRERCACTTTPFLDHNGPALFRLLKNAATTSISIYLHPRLLSTQTSPTKSESEFVLRTHNRILRTQQRGATKGPLTITLRPSPHTIAKARSSSLHTILPTRPIGPIRHSAVALERVLVQIVEADAGLERHQLRQAAYTSARASIEQVCMHMRGCARQPASQSIYPPTDDDQKDTPHHDQPTDQPTDLAGSASWGSMNSPVVSSGDQKYSSSAASSAPGRFRGSTASSLAASTIAFSSRTPLLYIAVRGG